MTTFQQLLDKATEDIEDFQRQILARVEQSENPTLPVLAQDSRLPVVDVKLQSKRTLKGHFGKIYAMHWSPSSPHILGSAAQDGKLLIWNAFSTARIQSIPLRSAWVMTCAFSTQGQTIACGGLDNICSIYRVNEQLSLEELEAGSRQQPIAELTGHEGYLSCCRFVTPNEIVTSSGDSTCMLWDVQQQQHVQQFSGHYGDVMSLSIHGNHNFVSGSVDCTAKLWDFRSKSTQSVKTFRGHESDINTVNFFPDGNAFVTGGDDSTCRLFDIRAVSQINRFSVAGLVCGVTSAAFSSTGRIMFAGYDDHTCHVYDTAHGTDLQTLSHDYRISSLGLNSEGKALATGSWDSTLKVFA